MGEAEAPDDSEETQESGSGKSTVRVERPFPRRTLEQAIRVAQVIRDNNGGNPWAKDQIAESLSIKAWSSNFTYLLADGALELSTTARSVLGSDLPLVHDDVTVEQLLAHRSGIGDYMDEDDPELDLNAYLLPVGTACH